MANTNPTPANAAGQPQPAGHPGGIFSHLFQLSAQLKAKDWAAALGTFVDIMVHLKNDWQSVQPVPGPVFGVSAPPDSGDLADQIEQLARQHQPAMQSAGAAGAFPWDVLLPQLLPLLIQALQAIFRRQ